MDVAAVVVNWNGGDENLECVRSLLESGVPPARIVFVDNASTDGSLESVRAAHPDLTFLTNKTNLGYGHGSNEGIAHALRTGADAVYLVNNDLVAPPEMLPRLVAELESDPTIGAAGPRVLYKNDPGRVWAAGGELTFRQNLTTLLGHGAPDGPEYQRVRDVDYVPGCSMLVGATVFERAGMLDGSYFAYHEDVDFCMQVLRAGFRVRLVGEVAAYHTTSASTGGGYSPRRKYMMGVNTIWFLRRHGTPVRWMRFFVYDVLSLPAVWAREVLRGNGRGVLAKALGMWHGALGRRVTAEAIQPGAHRLW